YSCGPTVYRDPSIGNYRATFTADLIRNTLKLFGYKVISVMNITDVGHLTSDADDGEDKLEKGAKREGISVWEVAKKYENIFMKGMKALNIDTFDVMPRATDHLAEQISLVQKLEEKAYTYEVPGDGIYMDTSKVENYGKLMGPNYKKRLEDLNAGIRVDMGGKRNPTDFALWKFNVTGQKRDMERDSPRGIGFPGWHIECSAMSSKYLGEQFDIHHGGADHITVHHSNEIAQSECGFGVHPWVKYWVHNEFLQVDGGKMSKSLGNVYTLEDVQKRGYSPLDLKYFYFMAQYSNFQNFTWEQLDVAKNTRQALIRKLQGREELKDRKEFENDPFFKEAMEAVSDNINTPKLLAIIQSSLNNVNENTYAIITFFENNFLKLGLFEEQEEVEIPSEVQELAQKRREAKKNKDWNTADSLRDQLTSLGWKILDRPDGFDLEKI
ncbi:MAG TPA: cysteine--tRNA ligase, partial [Candidatus Absconditabacterales bacterium]|nr:cysteine--tRNA ligase [Candidatus Absconditabacterales bacterium]